MPVHAGMQASRSMPGRRQQRRLDYCFRHQAQGGQGMRWERMGKLIQ
jgi:hypothetical protein